MNKSSYCGYFALTLAILFWGTSYLGTKVGLEVFSPLLLAFLRFSVAASIFFAILIVRRLEIPPARFHYQVARIAFFLPGLYFVFENFGLQSLSATRASIIAGLIPVSVALLSSLFLREQMGFRRIASLTLSLLGIGLLCVQQLDTASFKLVIGRGDLLMLGAVFSAAIYMLLVRRLSENYSSLVITAYQMLYGSLFFIPLLLVNQTTSRWEDLQLRHVLALCNLSLFSTFGAFICYNIALRRLAPSRASLGINVVPFITGLGSTLVYNEHIASSLVFGGVLVIAAAVLTHSGQPSQMELGGDEGHT